MNVVLKPRISEKAYGLSTLSNTYVIEVPLELNKIEAKRAIESQFNVTVIKITSLRQKGKKSRSLRLGDKSGRRIYGKKSDFKKVYATLEPKDSIKIFEEAKAEKKGKK